jgi:hypothetical protein
MASVSVDNADRAYGVDTISCSTFFALRVNVNPVGKKIPADYQSVYTLLFRNETRENMSKSCNTIIKKHHDRMKEDPEWPLTSY